MTVLECDAVLRAQLRPGEALLWSSPAEVKTVDRTTRSFMLAMGLGMVTTGIVLGIVLPVEVAGYVVLACFLPSLYFFLFWMIDKDQANACYGLTSQRVLVREGPFRRRFDSIALTDIDEVIVYHPPADRRSRINSRSVVELVRIGADVLVPGVSAPGSVFVQPHDAGITLPKARGPRIGFIRDADGLKARIEAARAARP